MKHALLITGLLWTLAPALSAQPITPTEENCNCIITQDVQYTASDSFRRLDTYVRGDTSDGPLVVWVHGGGFVGGDKANILAAQVADIMDKGSALISPNYRLSTNDPGRCRPWYGETNNYCVTNDDMMADVAQAVAWGMANVANNGEVVLWGYSAGSQIVVRLAAQTDWLSGVDLDPAQLHRVVAWDAPHHDAPWFIDLLATGQIPELQGNLPVNRRVFGMDAATQATRSAHTYAATLPGKQYMFVSAGQQIPTRTLTVTRDAADRFCAIAEPAGHSCTKVWHEDWTHADVRAKYETDNAYRLSVLDFMYPPQAPPSVTCDCTCTPEPCQCTVDVCEAL